MLAKDECIHRDMRILSCAGHKRHTLTSYEVYAALSLATLTTTAPMPGPFAHWR